MRRARRMLFVSILIHMNRSSDHRVNCVLSKVYKGKKLQCHASYSAQPDTVPELESLPWRGFSFSPYFFLPNVPLDNPIATAPLCMQRRKRKKRRENKEGTRATIADVPILLRKSIEPMTPSQQRGSPWDEKRKKGVDRQKFDVVLAVVAIGEMPNLNPLLLIRFYGSNHLIRSGLLVGVILKIPK